MKFDLYSILLLYLKRYKDIDFVSLDVAIAFKKIVDKHLLSINMEYILENKFCEFFTEDGNEFIKFKNPDEYDKVALYYDNLPFVFVLSTQAEDALELIGLQKRNGKIESKDLFKIKRDNRN